MIMLGDCLNRLKELPANSVDSIVTDPPAGISFMSKEWDSDKGGRENWINWLTEIMKEVKRVLKPGAHGLVWAIPRTSHWTATALENAGFEVRDVITHLFGSGFPKSHNLKGEWSGWGTALKPASEHWILVRKPLSEKTVSKNVIKWGVGALNIDESRIETSDKIAETKNQNIRGHLIGSGGNQRDRDTVYTQHTQGRWPANVIFDEDAAEVVNDFAGQDVARFFYVCGHENTKADVTSVGKKKGSKSASLSIATPGNSTTDQFPMDTISITKTTTRSIIKFQILSASQQENIGTCTIESEKIIKSLTASSIAAVRLVTNTEVLIYLSDAPPVHIKGTVSLALAQNSLNGAKPTENITTLTCEPITSGLKAFYVAKASKRERNAGLEGMPLRASQVDLPQGGIEEGNSRGHLTQNFHPTVKPIKLMEYLIKLVTPKGGVVLDPFLGSGTTGVAAKKLGFKFIGFELIPEYVEIAEKRMEAV